MPNENLMALLRGSSGGTLGGRRRGSGLLGGKFCLARQQIGRPATKCVKYNPKTKPKGWTPFGPFAAFDDSNPEGVALAKEQMAERFADLNTLSPAKLKKFMTLLDEEYPEDNVLTLSEKEYARLIKLLYPKKKVFTNPEGELETRPRRRVKVREFEEELPPRRRKTAAEVEEEVESAFVGTGLLGGCGCCGQAMPTGAGKHYSCKTYSKTKPYICTKYPKHTRTKAQIAATALLKKRTGFLKRLRQKEIRLGQEPTTRAEFFAQYKAKKTRRPRGAGLAEQLMGMGLY